MEFIIKEYGGIIILLICFSIAIGFISAFLTKCESIENTLLNVLFITDIIIFRAKLI